MERDRLGLPSNYVLLICGLPGSGKSTLSKALQTKLGIEKYVDLDTVTDMLAREHCRDSTHADWELAHSDEVLESIIMSVKSLIIDDVFPLRSTRRKVVQLARKHNKLTVEVYIDVVQSVCWNRIQQRNKDSTHIIVDETTFRRVAKLAEPPKRTSKRAIITQDTSDIDKISSQIITHLDILSKVKITVKHTQPPQISEQDIIETASRRLLNEVISENAHIKTNKELLKKLNNERRKAVHQQKIHPSKDWLDLSKQILMKLIKDE